MARGVARGSADRVRGGSSGEIRKLYNGGEFTLGIGIWIPAGRSFRILPKFTVGLGTLSSGDEKSGGPANPYSSFATFVMLGVAGFYNIDL